jgi:hypothetical protein
MSHSLIGQISALLVFSSVFPYIGSILKGKTKPNRATFAIWSAVGLITFLSYIASGATDTLWVAMVYPLCQIVIFGLSFRYGVGGTSKLDMVCIFLACAGVILWIITKNPLTALYISVFVEILGYIPTIKKSYFFPKTESLLSWEITTVGVTLNLLAISSWRPEIFVYPVYLFTFDVIVVALLLLPKFGITAKKP